MIDIIGKNIKKYRKEKGYTQKQLAELLGKAEITIRRYEACYMMPTVQGIEDICKVLEISKGDIFMNEEKKEMVNHPKHYNMGKYEAIDVIEDWNLNFNLGNSVKYLARAGHKDDIIEDLKKAERFIYLEYFIIEEGEFWNSILQTYKGEPLCLLNVKSIV